jgi:hypothetical protein
MSQSEGRIGAGFEWTPSRSAAAIEIAQGKTKAEVALLVGVNERTLFKWLACPEFSAEVDRLSLMIGIASRAERLRLVSRVVREKIRGESVETERDILDWLKFAQSETDGIKLNLVAAVAKAAGAMAGTGPDGMDRDAAAADGLLDDLASSAPGTT